MPMKKCLNAIWKNKALYMLALPVLVYIFIFNYLPIYGVQIAFRNYTFSRGITGSKWVGMKWFEMLADSPVFADVVLNTLSISIYSIVAGFPAPILLAIMFKYIHSNVLKKTAQTLTFLPHFVSNVVFCGMLICFLSPDSGFINGIITALGGKPVFFMGKEEYFTHIYVISGIWKEAGWGAIIYIAALASVSPELHEAAMLDGASKLKRIWHVDLPGILPTVVTMLILRCGSILSLGFEKSYALQNILNLGVSEVISTYNYKTGMLQQKYSYSAAMGLFNNVVNLILLSSVNFISKKLTEESLW